MLSTSLTGAKVQTWRENRGWSRTYVANKIGMSYGWIWKLEISNNELVPLYAALLFAAIDKNLEPME